ncbi:hypothetical protein DUI87_05637 [Hirundo rustica rustica]|uniref:Uncharacterized protein n=1 Tax=Hirundo rustica rustica TaxID=333673 RepID=A0A3M0KV85_HIRRU|nr:hypothetical protein DUI87_05637 [Hirundo rustica rustica]
MLPALGPTAGGCGAAGESPEEATEMFQGLEPLCSGARLGELEVLTWRGEGSRESSEPLPEPKGAQGELERDLGQGMEGQDTGNGFPLPEGRVRWDTGKEFLLVRVVRPWHRFPREAVAASGSLEVSKPLLYRESVLISSSQDAVYNKPNFNQEDIADPDSQEEKERNNWLSSPGDGSNTVKSVLTVQEYFAERMAKLKGSKKETETKVDHSSPAADEAVEPSEEMETKVKKKKKKQRRDDEAERAEDCEKPGKKPKTGSLNGKELDDPLNECHKRKKKRKHKEDEGENISCDENMGNGEISVGMSEGEELSAEEQEEKQKKRHKKKHKKQKEETGECGEGAPRKKKKHCKNI